MSSCLTAPTSTTASSRSCRSPAEAPLLVIACGALGGQLREIIARRGWPAELHCLPALLHNRPKNITIHAERLARAALARGQRVAVAYADCGTYGALDEVCHRLGLRRLPGLHCYDVRAGADPGVVRGRAGHLRAHRLPGPELRPGGARGTGARPAPGTVAGLLRALPPRGLARPEPRAGAGRGGGAGGGPVRPAAHRRADRDGRAGTGTGGARHRKPFVVGGATTTKECGGWRNDHKRCRQREAGRREAAVMRRAPGGGRDAPGAERPP